MSLLKTNEIQNYNGSSLTLTASTVSTSAQLNTGGNISVTGSLNVSDDSTTRTNLGLGSIATQAANAVDIDGGAIDGVTIGGTSAAAGTFTTFTSTGIDDNATSTAITIDSNENVGIGTSSISFSGFGAASKGLQISNPQPTIRLNDTDTSDNSYIAQVGPALYITNQGAGENRFYTNNTERMRIESTGATRPGADNTYDLGTSSNSWDDVYATNGTIQTSDINEKQDIEELSEAEHRVAIAAKGLLRKYRWKSAVAEKGDDARIHFGIIAQDLKAAFEAEGLDAGRYGMFIHSEWWETEETYTDDDGVEKTRINTFDTEEEAPEGAVKKDRMGVRYFELLAFIIAAI